MMSVPQCLREDLPVRIGRGILAQTIECRGYGLEGNNAVRVASFPELVGILTNIGTNINDTVDFVLFEECRDMGAEKQISESTGRSCPASKERDVCILSKHVRAAQGCEVLKKSLHGCGPDDASCSQAPAGGFRRAARLDANSARRRSASFISPFQRATS